MMQSLEAENGPINGTNVDTSISHLSPFELAQLGNLLPERSDEAKSLIPSLVDKIDDYELQVGTCIPVCCILIVV